MKNNCLYCFFIIYLLALLYMLLEANFENAQNRCEIGSFV